MKKAEIKLFLTILILFVKRIKNTASEFVLLINGCIIQSWMP